MREELFTRDEWWIANAVYSWVGLTSLPNSAANLRWCWHSIDLYLNKQDMRFRVLCSGASVSRCSSVEYGWLNWLHIPRKEWPHAVKSSSVIAIVRFHSAYDSPRMHCEFEHFIAEALLWSLLQCMRNTFPFARHVGYYSVQTYTLRYRVNITAVVTDMRDNGVRQFTCRQAHRFLSRLLCHLWGLFILV